MTIHRDTQLLGATVSIDVRDYGFKLGGLDGALGWLRYVDSARPPVAEWHSERLAAIDAAGGMLEAAGARDFRISVDGQTRRRGPAARPSARRVRAPSPPGLRRLAPR